MNIRCRFLGLALLTMLAAVGVPALSSAQGGPCSPSTPQYCPPPNVKTGPAKGVTDTSATLTGTVNPNGSATTCYFEYGLTTQYGSTTPAQNVGSGNKRQTVTATVTGLKPNTVYHYQLVCHNLGGNGSGGDKKFTTKKAHKPHKPHKPKVKTEKARHAGSNAATLRGRVNPHGSATMCHFRFGRTTHYGSTTRVRHVGSGTKRVTVTARIRHLSPKTFYHYELVCSNAGGRRVGGDRKLETKNKIRILGKRTIHVSKRGKLTVRLHCSGNHACVGFLTLTGKGGNRLTRPKRYDIPAHQTARITLRLKRRVLARLKRKHHLSGKLHARNLDGSSASRKVRLRARRS